MNTDLIIKMLLFTAGTGVFIGCAYWFSCYKDNQWVRKNLKVGDKVKFFLWENKVPGTIVDINDELITVAYRERETGIGQVYVTNISNIYAT